MFGEGLPRCPACRRDPALRREWGCDADAPRDLFTITCTVCAGGDVDCATCGGRGQQPIRRCPASHGDRSLAHAFDAFLQLESGILPVPGGWLAQADSFCAFVRIVRAERGAIDEAQRKAQERANATLHASVRR